MQASLWGKITDSIWSQTNFWKRQKETHHKWKGDVDGDNRKERKGYEGTTKDTFESHIQDITLKVRIKDGKSFNRNEQILPSDLTDLECESTSLDPYAYTWKAPEKCLLSVLKEDYARMLKNDNHYYKVRQNNSDTKYFFQVKNNPQRLCTKPTEVYPTTYDSMYVAIHYGGFDRKPYNRSEIWSQIAKINYPLKKAIPETEKIRRSYIQKKLY